MDLKELLNQTTIQTTKDINLIKSEPEPESEPEQDNDPEVTLDNIVESESIDERFKQSWNKLEKGMKRNRIVLFVEKEKEERSLSDNQGKDLKTLLFRACESGLFNKISEVKYNEEGYIESFKYLEFNESSKKYKLKTGSTKNRSVSKSRSNIDRLMKKK